MICLNRSSSQSGETKVGAEAGRRGTGAGRIKPSVSRPRDGAQAATAGIPCSLSYPTENRQLWKHELKKQK